MQYADVALSIRAGNRNAIFTYAITPAQIPSVKRGSLVEVPYRNKAVTGVITNLRHTLPNNLSPDKLRPIKRIMSMGPVMTAEDILLREKAAKYYQQPESLFFSLALPSRSIAKNFSISSFITRTDNSKNEVFLDSQILSEPVAKAIKKCIKDNKKILVLTPTKERLVDWQKRIELEYLGEKIFAYDSGLSNQTELWKFMSEAAEAGIIIGTRSAIFLPIASLGLIIIDTPSHHQFTEEQAPYYNVFTIALMRSRNHNLKLIISDPLPPLQLFVKPEKTLWQFHSPKFLPEIEIIEHTPRYPLSNSVVDTIKESLDKGQSVQIFAQQKGWAAGMICKDCKELVRCPLCSNVIRAATANTLFCSGCKKDYQAPANCSNCKSIQLQFFGWSIDRIKDYLIREHEFDQGLIAKISFSVSNYYSLPFQNADLIISLNPEISLFGESYKSYEEWLKMLLALRDATNNKLIIETSRPDLTIWSELTLALPKHAITEELRSRNKHGYPPFGRILNFSSKDHEQMTKIANSLKQVVDESGIFGPFEHPDGYSISAKITKFDSKIVSFISKLSSNIKLNMD